MSDHEQQEQHRRDDEDATATTAIPALDRLLAQAASLHRHGDGYGGSSSASQHQQQQPVLLDLRRLVPVHDSLIRASAASASASATSASEEGNDDDAAAFMDRLRLRVREEVEPERKLLIVQYLFHRIAASSSAPGLVSAALSVLHPSGEGGDDEIRKQERDDDGVEEEDGGCSDDGLLLEAVLDAAFFCRSGEEEDGEQDAGEWKGCLDACRQRGASSSDGYDRGFKVASRVLARLHGWLTSTTSSSWSQKRDDASCAAEGMVVQAAADLVVSGMGEAVCGGTDGGFGGGGNGSGAARQQQSFYGLSRWLRPIHDDLLPIVLPPPRPRPSSSPSSSGDGTTAAGSTSPKQHLDAIWTSVWDRYAAASDGGSTNLGAVLVVATSVLCSILPGRCLSGWPAPAGGGGDDALVPAIRFAPLWDLVRRCVSLGQLRVPKKLATWAKDLPSSASAAGEEEKEGEAAAQLDEGTCQLLRRRGLYLLGSMVSELRQSGQEKADEDLTRSALLWNKYVACFETAEMENVPHLIDQIWETLGEVASQCRSSGAGDEDSQCPPRMSWIWIKPLLSRLVTFPDNPGMRKLVLYRLFTGQAGILLTDDAAAGSSCSDGGSDWKGPKKNRTQNSPARASSGRYGAPLSVVTSDFVLRAVLPAFDTLEGSVGTMIHLEDNRKELRVDVSELMPEFLRAYLGTMSEGQCQDFFHGLWDTAFVCRMNRKAMVHVFSTLAASVKEQQQRLRIPIPKHSLKTLNCSLKALLTHGSLIPPYQESLLGSIATLLACSKPIGQLPPDVILKTLAMFPLPELRSANDTDCLDGNVTFANLKQWLFNVGDGKVGWAATVGAATAAAYVDGLFSSTSAAATGWNPLLGTSANDTQLGKAVVYFCSLSTGSKVEGKGVGTAAGELLWPAINKGISKAPAAMLASTAWPNADKVIRALTLLDHGCKLKVISGMGNGDLVVDRKTGQMMPPPANVETILGNSVSFILHHIQFLTSGNEDSQTLAAIEISSIYEGLIGQLHTIHEGYPSSMTISSSVDNIANENSRAIVKGSFIDPMEAVQRVTIVYAALACGGEVESSQTIATAEAILSINFEDLKKKCTSATQATRSVFEDARWGALSLLLPIVLDKSQNTNKEQTKAFINKLLDIAAEAVQLGPNDALLSCILTAAKDRFSLEEPVESLSDDDVSHLEKVINAVVDSIHDCRNSIDAASRLDEICRFLFQSELMLDEAKRLQRNQNSPAPIRKAFRRFIEMAGRQRPHIAETVLCRAVCGWLQMKASPADGGDHGTNAKSTVAAGVSAIPYTDDIVALLLHKEEWMAESSKVHDSASRKAAPQSREEDPIVLLPEGTNGSSIARGYILIFLSKLPAVEEGLSLTVLTELLHPVILCLLDKVKPIKNPKGQQVMLGSFEYCNKMRGWQALCLLSRFVTTKIVQSVCNKVLEYMSEMIHGQIRYFIEVFTVQCARKHPAVFGNGLIEHITRTDLSLQHVASLMVVAGNLIAGRYSSDFFRQYDNKAEDATKLHLVLSGAIPWLGSTQGFSRAIAQLLVYKVIPMVVDLNVAPKGPGTEDSDWYLRSIYNFLDMNAEMKRLRKKQSNFFERYDVDSICTPEGLLGFPVDEGGESMPVTLIDAMKETLREVYQESHDAPVWKYMQSALDSRQKPSSSDGSNNGGSDVNFQRKIIPLDALNLALEDVQERRKRNKAGRKKQRLIVCATFIDKVPNLGGLARTAEIFAAERLVVPDILLTKTDSFAGLSVTAGDWIDIEECKEENLHAWLRDRKGEGYYVVGLEQTSSSVPLTDYAFPDDKPIVLLLGKEKEGIPVEYLQIVDQCIEIPQLGIIRSLNVHVSGAIAIWEQTRQKMAKGKL